MKKALVVLLAVVLVLAFASSAFAYTDTNNLSTREQDAIYELSALGVLKGDGDGTFAPARTISRAEFAKIACYLGGFGPSADNYVGTAAKYSDVPDSHWAAGYIAAADSYGYVKGYTDGTYKPDQTINMQEAVTILLRVAGYNDNLPGPWPFDYIAQAAKIGVTNGVAFNATAGASRASVAVMAANLLDCSIVYWNGAKETFLSIDDNDYGYLPKVVNDPDYPTVRYNFDDGRILHNAFIEDWFVASYANKTRGLNLDYVVPGFRPRPGDVNVIKATQEFQVVARGFALYDDAYITDNAYFNEINGYIADVYFDKDPAKYPDAKIIYVGLKSTVSYSKDVDIVDAAREIVRVDGKEVTLDYFVDSDITNMSPNNNVCKIWKNANGYIYYIEALPTQLPIAVFDSYNSATGYVYMHNNTADPLAAYVGNQEIVAIKDGKIIYLSEMTKGDVVTNDMWVLPGSLWGASTYKEHGVDIALTYPAVKAGKLEKADYANVTIDGVGYSWPNPQVAAISTNGFKSYATMESVHDLDNAYGKDVKYILINPFKLGFIDYGAAASAYSTVYGVVKSATLDAAGYINNLTVYTAEGKDVVYPVKANLALWDSDRNGDVDNGSFVELQVKTATGVIEGIKGLDAGSTYTQGGTTHNRNGVAHYYAGYDGNKWSNLFDRFANAYAGYVTEDDIFARSLNAGRLQINGTFYDVLDSTVIFNIVVDDTPEGYDQNGGLYSMSKVYTIANADFQASKNFSADFLLAKVNAKGDLAVLVLMNSRNAGAYKCGLIEDVYANGAAANTCNVVIDGVTYLCSTSAYPDGVIYDLEGVAYCEYRIEDGKIVDIRPLVIGDEGEDLDFTSFGGEWVYDDGTTDSEFSYYCYLYPALSTTTLTIAGENFKINDATKFYRVAANGKIVALSANPISPAGNLCAIAITTNGTDKILKAVFIVPDDEY